MTSCSRWFIHPETAISINRNESIPLCVFKTHYRDRGSTVPNHRIFMQIQFSGHTIKHAVWGLPNRMNGWNLGGYTFQPCSIHRLEI